MRTFAVCGVLCAAFLITTTQASAQGIFSPTQPVTPAGVTTVIGPDGTYYALEPASGSTNENPSTTLEAAGLPGSATSKWSVTLTGNIGQVLPGVNTVFVVQTVTSGSGHSTTSTTTVLTLAVATGKTVSNGITPAGSISDIEVRTVGGSDYLYITTISRSSSTSGGTTTTTTTREVTVYSQTGAVVETISL